MATKLGTIIADFTTSLATSMAIGATTASLQSATDDDGVALPTGTYYFAIDGNNTQKEHIQATLTGTSLTAIQSVSRQGALTSGCVRSHRVGSPVTLTDFAHIKFINDVVSGATTLNASVPLGYDGTATISTANQLATKAYVDGVAIAGGADASTSVKGITKLSVAPASSTAPIAVGDNDTRMPTTSQTAALVGDNTTIAVGSGNKFVTQTGLQNGAEVYAASTGSANAYVLTLSPVPTALAAGQEFSFKANFTNTGAATLNPNSLGATAIRKLDGATALASGDIVSGQIVKVKYDGTNFQMVSQVGQVQSTFRGLFGKGSTTRSLATATGTQNIAHGLGFTPLSYEVVSAYVITNTAMNMAMTFSGTSISFNTAAGGGFGGSNTSFIAFDDNAGNTYTGTFSADATNIIISWTRAGTPSGTINIIWKAYA